MQYTAQLERVEYLPSCQFLWKDLSIKERVLAAAQAGFNGVDFWDWRDKDIDLLANLAKDNGIYVNAVFGAPKGSLCNSDDHDSILEQYKSSLETAHRCGIKFLFVQTDEIGEGGRAVSPIRPHSETERWIELEEGLAKIVSLVDDAGIDVGLLLEPLSNIDVFGYLLQTMEDGFRLVEKINNPRLTVIFDLYHQQINEGNLIHNLRKTISRVNTIHVSDAPGRGAPGTGEINISNIWREIQALGFDGVIGFETIPGEGTTEMVMDKIKQVFPWPASAIS